MINKNILVERVGNSDSHLKKEVVEIGKHTGLMEMRSTSQRNVNAHSIRNNGSHSLRLAIAKDGLVERIVLLERVDLLP